MHPDWQGGFPQKALGERVRAPTSGSCSEPSSGETSSCLWTRKEKLAGEVGSLRLHSMTTSISLLKIGGSGKNTFKIKTAAAFILPIFPRGTPKTSDFAGAGGLVCAGVSFPDRANVWTAEITRRCTSGAGLGQEHPLPLGTGRCPGKLHAWC